MALGRVLVVVSLMAALSGCTDDQSTRRAGGDITASASAVLRMTQPRAVHRATLLSDGSVLVTGGCTERGCGGFDAGRRAERYVPGRGLVADAEMATPRASGTATLLADGRVLLVGGYPGEGRPPTSSAEVYDPATDSFAAVGDLGTARADHSATLLPDGQVMVAGGFDAEGGALSTTEYFDPATGEFRPGPGLSQPRAAHVAVLAGRDLVLVGGTQTPRPSRPPTSSTSTPASASVRGRPARTS